jgi:hypothetical protein
MGDYGKARRMEVFMVHYRDRDGVTHRRRVVAVDEGAAKRRTEVLEGPGSVERVEPAPSADKIRPLGGAVGPYKG